MSLPIPFKPHEYQRPIQAALQRENIFGVFIFPGAGKTVLALEKIYTHREPTLVIAPLDILYTVWHTEPKKWDFSQTLKINLLHGPDKEANFYKSGGIHLINPEGIPWLVNKIIATNRFPWSNLLIDESAKFKNPKSVRFKALMKILKSFKRRFILSGNPMPNHYLDLWAQMFILDRGLRLGTSWYSFRDRYFYPVDYNRFNWVLKPGAKEEIIAAIADITIFLDPSSELDLPTRRVIDHEIPLSNSVMVEYKKMENSLFVDIDDNRVTASNVAVGSLKCWQMASGFVYETHKPTIENPNPQRKTHQIHRVFIDHAKTLVESMQGSPVLLVYNFLEDYHRLGDAFPNARFVPAGSTPSEVQSAERDWNQDKIEVLIVHIAKFSHGLNLQYGSGHQIIFYGLTYNADTYEQLIRRFERQGAKFKEVILHRMLAKDTIHKAIVTSLERKGSASESFLLALKEYRDSQ